MTFGTFRKRSLAEEIVQRLLALIQEKELGPGDKLPPLRELAATMGVSVPSLREALRALELMNVVEIRHGSGTYIASLAPDSLVEHLDFVLSLGDQMHLHVFQARKILEVGIVALAAQEATDDELAHIDEIVAQTANVVGDREAFLRLDLELHDAIARATHNPVLARLMLSIRRLGEESRRRSQSEAAIRLGLQHHRDIAAALRSRNPQRAREAMLNHLNESEELVKVVFLPDGAGHAVTSPDATL